MSYKKNLGKLGENLVELYLRRDGKKIISRNYNSKFGEIDIIAAEDDLYIFVEVKTRKSSEFGNALYSIDKKKQEHLINSAIEYLKENKLENPFRFDVAVVTFEYKNKYDIEYLVDVITRIE